MGCHWVRAVPKIAACAGSGSGFRAILLGSLVSLAYLVGKRNGNTFDLQAGWAYRDIAYSAVDMGPKTGASNGNEHGT